MTESIHADQISGTKKIRNAVILASYLVLRKEKEVLLLRRFQTGYEDGKYSLPAGHVDAGETCTDAMIREAHEEIGITLDPGNIRVAYVMHRKALDSERIDIFFVAEHWEGEVCNREPNKCDDLSWFPSSVLPDNIIPYIRQALICIDKGVVYSEHGW